MSAAIAAPLERARILARTASIVACAAAALLGLGATFDVAEPAFAALDSLPWSWGRAAELANLMGAQLVLAAPSFILAGACYDLSRVLGEYGEGRFFTPRAAAGVRKAGEGVLWAMAFKCALSPTLYNYVAEGARGGGPFIRFEIFDFGLVALGFFVMIMGRVLQAAAAIKAENDEIV